MSAGMTTAHKILSSFSGILCLVLSIFNGVGMTSKYKSSDFRRFYGGLPVFPMERFQNIYPTDVVFCALKCNYNVDCTHFNTTDDMSYCLLYNYPYCGQHWPGENWNMWVKRGKIIYIYV